MEKTVNIDAYKIVIKKLGEINVKDRSRKDAGDIEGLANSLEENGQLNPVTLENGNLRTGGRRYMAAGWLAAHERSIGGKLPENDGRRLAVGEILAVEWNDLSDAEKLIIELEENRRRKDFERGEEALMLDRIKRLYEAVQKEQTGEESEMTVRQLAKLTGYSVGQVTMGLSVATEIKKHEASGNVQAAKELRQANSIFGAYQAANAQKARSKIVSSLEKTVKINDDLDKRILCMDGLDFLKGFNDKSVDFINFDPPWGIGVDDYDRHQNYEEWDDSPLSWERIILPAIPELYRVLKDDRYAVVWFGVQYYDKLVKALESAGCDQKHKHTDKCPGFKIDPVPRIWEKPNKSGSQNDPSKTEINAYEMFLRIQKGDARLFKTGRTVFSYNMPTREARIHFAQKPVDLLVEMLERYSHSTMVVIDPTAGSFALAQACKRLGRQFFGCDKSQKNVDNAKAWLRRINATSK